MPSILLINPNTSTATATTDVMAALARAEAPPGCEVVGATARSGPPMIVRPDELEASAAEVLALHRTQGAAHAGTIALAADPAALEAALARLLPLVDGPGGAHGA